MQSPDHETDAPSGLLTAVLVVFAILLWLVVAGELLLGVPFFDRKFAEFRLVLPSITDAVVHCSRWCVKYPYVLPVPFAIIVAAVVIPTWLLRHRGRKRQAGALWGLLMLALPAALALLIWLACYLPFEKLMEGLAAPKG